MGENWFDNVAEHSTLGYSDGGFTRLMKAKLGAQSSRVFPVDAVGFVFLDEDYR